MKSEHDCGRVGVLLPSITFSDSSPSRVPSPMHGEKKSQSETGNHFLRISKTLLCLRSARGGCSYMFSHLAKTHRFSQLTVRVETVVFCVESALTWLSFGPDFMILCRVTHRPSR